MDYKQIIEAMKGMDDDGDNEKLQKAMEHYCSMYDCREGYKYALEMTLRDQYENHAGEEEEDDLEKIIEILGL